MREVFAEELFKLYADYKLKTSTVRKVISVFVRFFVLKGIVKLLSFIQRSNLKFYLSFLDFKK